MLGTTGHSHGWASSFAQTESRIFYYKGLSNRYPSPRQRQEVSDIISSGQQHTFHLTDLDVATQQFEKWEKTMPSIDPYYAVKCNDSINIVEHFAKLGGGFDCASREEMEKCISVGVSPKKIILSNPCKNDQDIIYAKSKGIKRMTFDSVSELEKVRELYPEADLLLRMSIFDKNAKIPLCFKAGAGEADWDELLTTAKNLGLRVRGPMFHVGTGSEADNSAAYESGMQDCWTMFKKASKLGMKFDTIDIGGGQVDEHLDDIYAKLKPWMAKFPDYVHWVGEPGRYLAAPCQTVAVKVIGKRNGSVTVDDGVHGSFSNVLQEHQVLSKELPLDQKGDFTGPVHSSEVFGPTCDGLDSVAKDLMVPNDIRRGDWLVFAGMGAYTQVTSSGFNGMVRSAEKVLREEVRQDEDEGAFSSLWPQLKALRPIFGT